MGYSEITPPYAVPAPLESRTVGDFRLTWIPDGIAHFDPVKFFPQSDEESWQRHRDALDENAHVCATLGAILVQTPDHTVLVDTGIGPQHFKMDIGASGGGSFLTNLHAFGIEPEQIDTVVYTHFHVDHTGWTTVKTDEGYRLRFENAIHAVHSAEWEYWQGQDTRGFSFEALEQPLTERISLLEDGQSVVPGVSILHAPGHTPGHALVVVSSGDQRAVITGDAVHSPVQIEEHEWGCRGDVDPAVARSTRETLFNELLKPKTLGVGSHFPNSVFGRAVLTERRMHWVGWAGPSSSEETS